MLTREAVSANSGRWLRGLYYRRFGRGDAVHCTIGRINARNRRARHGRLDASSRVVMLVTEITSNERGDATAQPAVFIRLNVVGRDDLFGHFFVFYSAVRRLRRAVLPNHLDKFLALFTQDALHAANGVALAVEQMPNTTQ